MASPLLDDVDLQILAALQHNGRKTNVDLATEVGLTAPPCLRRVRGLETRGVIRGYHAALDPVALGFGISIFAMVSLKSQAEADLRAFEAHVADDLVVGDQILMIGAAHRARIAAPVDDDGRRAIRDDAGTRVLRVAVHVDKNVDLIGCDRQRCVEIGEHGDIAPDVHGGADALLHRIGRTRFAAIIRVDFELAFVVGLEDLDRICGTGASV